MLYYCVCFEASSLVISGQPFCLFFPSIIHPCNSFLYCLPFECAVLLSCAMDFNYRIAFFPPSNFFHEKEEHTLNVYHLWPQYLLFLTCHTVTSCTSYFSAELRACVRNSDLSLGACLPGQCHYYLQCLFWMVSVKACVMCAWTQPKSILCVPYAYMRVSVQSQAQIKYQMFFVLFCFFHHKLKGIFFLLQIPQLQTCSLTLSLKSAVYLKKNSLTFGKCDFQGFGEKMDTTLMSVRQIWNYSQQVVT